jgi:UDP-N-acetylglucosamine 2-epimerase (non-hydrolysing)
MLEGISPQTTFVTGSPLTEVLTFYKPQIDASNILEELNITKRKYFLVSAHREENVENDVVLAKLVSSLNFLAEEFALPIILSLHPRTRRKVESLRISFHKRIIAHKPFGFFAYNKLQNNAYCVLSDSGSIQEESAIGRFRAVQIRYSTERPEAFDAGSIILCGVEKHAILQAVKITVARDYPPEIPTDYQSIHVSEKVIRLLAGFASLAKQKRL